MCGFSFERTNIMSFPERDLHGPNQTDAIRDLIQSIFIFELLQPSELLWLHFAWVSDVDILDNSSRKYAWINPAWPSTKIKLTEVLEVLLSKGGHLRLLIRKDPHNDYILRNLKRLKTEFPNRIQWRVIDGFHDKGMVGDHYFLTGTMNLTKRGISRNNEHIYFKTDPAPISAQRIHLQREWEKYSE